MTLTWPPSWLSGKKKSACQAGSEGKESACNGGLGPIPGWEGTVKKEMATHSSILTWEIPWTEEAGGPQFIGLQESDMTEVTKNMTFT